MASPPNIVPTLDDLKEAYQAAGRAGDNEAAREIGKAIEAYKIPGEDRATREERLYGSTVQPARINSSGMVILIINDK